VEQIAAYSDSTGSILAQGRATEGDRRLQGMVAGRVRADERREYNLRVVSAAHDSDDALAAAH
jgi:hypothetical protein